MKNLKPSTKVLSDAELDGEVEVGDEIMMLL